MSPKPKAYMHDRSRGRSYGFTLIEILVVIVIVAVLASLVAPDVFRHVGDAKSEAAQSQIETLALALNAYRLDNGAYPSTAQGLAALRTKPDAGADPVDTQLGEISSSHPTQGWRGPYLARLVPSDPWGRPYIYMSPGRVNPGSYDLYTLGRDGVEGGTGEDADVTSWQGSVNGPATGITNTSENDRSNTGGGVIP